MNKVKIVIFIALTIAFITLIFYLADLKARIARVEVKVEHLEKK